MPKLYSTISEQMFHAGKIALVLVGLPATGKTYISHKLSRYLRWLGVRATPFTLAMYREKMFGKQRHGFFDPENKDALERRKILMEHALADMVDYFATGGQVAIFDGTNVTQAQRNNIYEKLTPKSIQVIFIELINTNPAISQEIFVEEMQTSPNYAGYVASEASADLTARIEHYTKIYQPISKEDSRYSYIKLFNIAERIVVHNIKGYLQTRIVFFLINVHVGFRSIFLYRDDCGEDGKIFMEGGRKSLSETGNQHAKQLKIQVMNEIRSPDGLNFGAIDQPITIWTSPNTRSKDVASHFQSMGSIVEINALMDMNPGVVDNMTPEQIKEKYPLEYEEYQQDVYNYRFPRAESYRDMAFRLEPVILELERGAGHILVIAQKPILQCLYSYFTDLPEMSIPSVEIPEYSLIQLLPRAYTCLNKTLKITE